MFTKLYCWSQLSQCPFIMHIFQTKFWNQLIRIWHRPTSLQEIALELNILSVTSFNHVTLNWNITIFFPVKHEQLFATPKSIQSHLLKDGPCWCLRRAGMLSFLSRAAQMQFATEVWHQNTAEATGEQLDTYPQQSPCLLLKFQSVTKNLTKLYPRLNRREISLWIFPHQVPRIATKPQKHIEGMNGSVPVLSMSAATSLWSLPGLSFCSYIKTPSNFRFSKLRILSEWPFFPNNQSTIHGVFWTLNICF